MIESIYQYWYFLRPELAKRIFNMLREGSGDPLSLIGERRIGKTSHLRGELMEEARRNNYLPVYIDIQQHRQKPLEAINSALQDAIDDIEVPSSNVKRNLKTPIKKVGAAGFSIDFDETPKRRRPSDPHLEIAWLVKELIQKADRPALLIFDEIQELATAPDGDNITASIRSAITKNKERIRVVFTGSSQIKLIEMFSKSRAALYEGASTLSFPLLGEDFLSFVEARAQARFKRWPSKKELTDAFARLQYRPRQLIDLVILFASTDAKSLVGLLDQGVADELANRDFESLWASLSPLQQKICMRIAQTQAVTSLEARLEYGRGKGQAKKVVRELSPGSVSRALNSMVKQHVITNPGRGVYRFDDPLYGEWLRQRQS
jgi:uncharacterized protein